MKSSDGTRDVSATAPTTPLEEPGSKTSGRSQDGGGYGAQFARQVEAGGVGWGQENHRRDPLAPPAAGGDARWFEQSNRASAPFGG